MHTKNGLQFEPQSSNAADIPGVVSISSPSLMEFYKVTT
jgi:hypothetical protein